MSGDLFGPVRSGDPLRIPAPVWNNLLAMESRNRRPSQDPRFGAEFGDGADLIWVKNNLVIDSVETDARRFWVLGIDDVVISSDENLDEFKNGIILEGVLPDALDHSGKFVILAEAIPFGQIGRAWISGLAVAQVHFPTLSSIYYGRADLKDGDATCLAHSQDGAAQILWIEGTGYGRKWAVVRMSTAAPWKEVAFLRSPSWVHSGAGSGSICSQSDSINPQYSESSCFGNLAAVGVEILTVSSAGDPSLRFTRPGVFDVRMDVTVVPYGYNWTSTYTSTDVAGQPAGHAQYQKYNDSKVRTLTRFSTSGEDLDLIQHVESGYSPTYWPTAHMTKYISFSQASIDAGNADAVVDVNVDGMTAGSTAEVNVADLEIFIERVSGMPFKYSDQY